MTCKSCSKLFVNPRPSIETLRQFYVESQSDNFWVNGFFEPVAEARREKIFRPRAQYLVERFGPDQEWTIGDIGAGFGIFIEELRHFWPGGHFVAIEPSKGQANICRDKGIQVECCLLEEVKGYDNSFDLLVAFELFDHLHSPKDFPGKVHNLLKQGGLFLMTTLNGQGFDILMLWDRSKSFLPPLHLNYFNPRSIEILVRNYGFNIEEISTPGQLDWDIVEGMILREGVDIGRFWKFLAESKKVEAKESLQDWIAKYQFSSHMRVLAKKASNF